MTGDRFIAEFDRALRTLFCSASSRRPIPGGCVTDADPARVDRPETDRGSSWEAVGKSEPVSARQEARNGVALDHRGRAYASTVVAP